MKYRKGFKYQLAENETFETPFKSEINIHLPFISLHTTGRLIGRKGYAWDGCSGPTIDTRTVRRG